MSLEDDNPRLQVVSRELKKTFGDEERKLIPNSE